MPTLTKPTHDAVPYMAQTYKAANRNVAVILLREALKGAR
jgi:hypothetical protein